MMSRFWWGLMRLFTPRQKFSAPNQSAGLALAIAQNQADIQTENRQRAAWWQEQPDIDLRELRWLQERTQEQTNG